MSIVFKLAMFIVWFLDMSILGRTNMRKDAHPRKVATGSVEPVPGNAGDTMTLKSPWLSLCLVLIAIYN